MFEAASRAREVWVLLLRRMWPKNCWSETHGQCIGTLLSVSLSFWNQSRLLVLLVRFGKILFSFNWLQESLFNDLGDVFLNYSFVPVKIRCFENWTDWKNFEINFMFFCLERLLHFKQFAEQSKLNKTMVCRNTSIVIVGKMFCSLSSFPKPKIVCITFSLSWSKGSFSGSLWCESFCISRASWSVSCNIW